MPRTRQQAQKEEDERRCVKNEALHERRMEALRRDPNSWPLITIDSDGERQEADGPQPPKRARTNGPQEVGEDEAVPSGLQPQPRIAAPVVEEAQAEAPPVVVKQELLELKQEADVPRRRKKKKKKRVDRAAANRMGEMERQIEAFEQTITELKRLNASRMAEQAREIAELKQKLADAAGPAGVNESITTTVACQTEHPLPVPPNDRAIVQKKKPKLKDDARRALMTHAFGIAWGGGEQAASGGAQFRNHERLRLTRLQTARFFVCGRSFSVVFFRPSERYAQTIEQELRVGLSDELCSLSPASGAFRFYLTFDCRSRQSLSAFLQLGRAEVRRLVLGIDTTERSLYNDASSNWSQLLPALQNLRELTAVVVAIDPRYCYFSQRQSIELIDALRESLPDPITSFTSRHLEDFRLLAPEVRRTPVGKAHYVVDFDNQSSSFGRLFRANARVIDVRNCVTQLAKHGSCEPNAAIEKVRLQTSITYPKTDWSEEIVLKFRSLFANLCPLNDRFLSLYNFKCHLDAAITRGLQLVQDAKRAGIATVECEAAVSVSNPIWNWTEYEQMWSASRRLFREHPEFELQAEDLDDDLVEKHAHESKQPFCIWKAASSGHKFRLLFLYPTQE
ncbi:hypothetical protein M3Y99_00130800 [Aphelenchoides fujianensis]|nr:hypothetical protein M3Y99_00130800 [Aphelenchoides fujianensis]